MLGQLLIFSGFQDISVTKKSTEKYHLWHRAVVKSLDPEKKVCLVKFEHSVTGQKRKLGSNECSVKIEDIYPLDSKYPKT